MNKVSFDDVKEVMTSSDWMTTCILKNVVSNKKKTFLNLSNLQLLDQKSFVTFRKGGG
jgi:hypothetical protein